ncbi:MAG TPA: hypothetical protein VL242_36415, partial [Sorangium sp.]|nr:hypothetical protein [Sorangium sp.]
IATKTAAFLARHPSVALTNGAYFARSVVHDNNPLKDSVVKLFFCRLFYRNCLLSEAQGQAHPQRRPAERHRGGSSRASTQRGYATHSDAGSRSALSPNRTEPVNKDF